MEFAIIKMWHDPLTRELRREELDIQVAPYNVSAQDALAEWHIRRYGNLPHRPSKGQYVSELRDANSVLLCIVQA